MVSELAAEGAGWAAAAFGGIFLGAVAAWCLGAPFPRRGPGAGRCRRALSRACLGLAASVSSLAVLLILPPKPLLEDPALWVWAGAWVALGALSASFPKWAGIPLIVMLCSILGLASAEASGWHAAVPGREAARLVPYGVTAEGAAGDLSVPDRNAVPVLSRVVLGGLECFLEARVLDLSGPFAPLFGARRYRLTRLYDGAGSALLEFPRKSGPLGFLLSDREFHLGWISLRTVRSPRMPLEPLLPLSWSFDGEGSLAVRNP